MKQRGNRSLRFPHYQQNHRESVDNPVDAVLSGGRVTELASQTILVSRDGKERIIADSVAPIKDKHNQIIGAVLVFAI